MLKIVIINGTQATSGSLGMKRGKSNTTFVLRHVEEKIKEGLSECRFETLMLGEMEIKRCDSCAICCVPGGKCPLQGGGDDSVEFIMNKMLEADLLLIASPVYCMEVSGIIKNLFDRLAWYFHLPVLRGKPCVSLTTYNLYDEIAKLYLSTAMKALGVQYIGNISASVLGDRTGHMAIDRMDELDREIGELLGKARKVLAGEMRIEPSARDKEIFEKMKNRWIENKRYTKKGYEFWKENGLIDAEYYY